MGRKEFQIEKAKKAFDMLKGNAVDENVDDSLEEEYSIIQKPTELS
jgi:hypothetical protein